MHVHDVGIERADTVDDPRWPATKSHGSDDVSRHAASVVDEVVRHASALERLRLMRRVHDVETNPRAAYRAGNGRHRHPRGEQRLGAPPVGIGVKKNLDDVERLAG
jgi:hypothetical protein